MDTKVLRTACIVAELGSVTKAAHYLGVSQSTISGHLRKLEKELGVRLFDRSTVPLRLTRQGEGFVRNVRPLLAKLNSTIGHAEDPESDSPVRVAADHTLIHTWLVGPVADFRAAHPGVPLRLLDGKPSDILAMLRKGNADVGILPLPLAPSSEQVDLHLEHLCDLERVIITPRDHTLRSEKTVALKDLAQYPFVVVNERSLFTTHNDLEIELRRNGLSLNIVLEVDRQDSVVSYVARGVGISIVPRAILGVAERNTIGVVGLGGLLEDLRMGLVTLDRMAQSKTLAAFTDVLKTTGKEK